MRLHTKNLGCALVLSALNRIFSPLDLFHVWEILNNIMISRPFVCCRKSYVCKCARKWTHSVPSLVQSVLLLQPTKNPISRAHTHAECAGIPKTSQMKICKNTKMVNLCHKLISSFSRRKNREKKTLENKICVNNARTWSQWFEAGPSAVTPCLASRRPRGKRRRATNDFTPLECWCCSHFYFAIWSFLIWFCATNENNWIWTAHQFRCCSSGLWTI